MDTITVRKMAFDFTDDMDLVFIQHDPGFSFVFLGTWMLLPYLEPYLMRTVRRAMDEVKDERLKYEMKQFCSQEGQHYKQHAKANDRIIAKMPEGPRRKLQLKLAEIEQQYKDFFEHKPLAWNLAYAEGFEAYTAAGARTQMELRVFDYMKDPIRDLMLWHIMEEMEHRNVAFDAYEAVAGGYWYRLRVGFWAQRHFVGLGKELAAIMTEAFPDLIAAHDNPQAKKIRNEHRRAYLWRTLRNLPGIYMPWYSPHKLALPPLYEEARSEYDNRALSKAA